MVFYLNRLYFRVDLFIYLLNTVCFFVFFFLWRALASRALKSTYKIKCVLSVIIVFCVSPTHAGLFLTYVASIIGKCVKKAWQKLWPTIFRLSIFAGSRGHLTAGWGGRCLFYFPGGLSLSKQREPVLSAASLTFSLHKLVSIIFFVILNKGSSMERIVMFYPYRFKWYEMVWYYSCSSGYCCVFILILVLLNLELFFQ